MSEAIPAVAPLAPDESPIDVDLVRTSVRELNADLHGARDRCVRVHEPGRPSQPRGRAARTVTVEIDGHVGYYCAGMNQRATCASRAAAASAWPRT